MSSLHIKHLPRELAISYAAKTNLLLLSKPAVGKTETTEATGKTMAERVEGFKVWRFDMTTANPTDLMAYMPNEKTHKLECYENVMLPNGAQEPNAVGFVVLDEVLNGDPTTVKVFQKYINGEKIGDRFWKPEGVICVMMSNRMGDKAGVMQQSRAFLRRTEQIEIVSDAAHNLKFAEGAGWWPVVTEFLKKYPDLIDNYDQVYDPEAQKDGKLTKEDIADKSEEGKRGIWANMASWTRISKLEYAANTLKWEMNPSRFIANVGRGPGQAYATFRAMFAKIASVDDILASPKTVAIPTNVAELYVMTCMLTELMPEEAISKASVFIDRLQGDIRAMAVRRIVKRSQKNRATFNISKSKEYVKWMQDPELSDLFMAAQ